MAAAILRLMMIKIFPNENGSVVSHVSQEGVPQYEVHVGLL
jgi:hypothetical protein